MQRSVGLSIMVGHKGLSLLNFQTKRSSFKFSTVGVEDFKIATKHLNLSIGVLLNFKKAYCRCHISALSSWTEADNWETELMGG